MIHLKITKDNIVSCIYQNYLKDATKAAYLLQIKKNVFEPAQYKTVTYEALVTSLASFAQQLEDAQLIGKRVIILHPLTPELLSLIFAMFKSGVIPVFIDPNVGIDHSITCIKNSKADIVFTKTLLMPLVKVLVRRTKVCKVITFGLLKKQGRKRIQTNGHHPPDRKATIAGVFYTSGSTGVPKGAIWTHQNLKAQVNSIETIVGNGKNTTCFALFPLLLIYGPVMGYTTIWPKCDISKPKKITPKIIIETAKSFRINYSFGSPLTWKNLAKHCYAKQVKIQNIDAILCGGAPIGEHLIAKMQQLLLSGSFYITYGATEALPISYYKSTSDLSNYHNPGTLIGNSFQNTEIRIKPLQKKTSNIPCTTYKIGEILVKGKQVTPGYINTVNLTKLNTHENQWHPTGDYGYLDGDNTLWYYGRISHAIEFNGKRYYPVPIEKQIKQFINGNFCSIAVVKGNLCLILEKKYFRSLKMGRQEFLGNLNEVADIDCTFSQLLLYPKPFPFDKRHYSKLDRIKIQHWATTQRITTI